MLTNARVRDSKPQARRYEVTCEALPGFILRVLPSGKKVFFARFCGADGKDRRVRLGLWGPGFGVDEARLVALRVLTEARGAATAATSPAAPVAAPVAATRAAPAGRSAGRGRRVVDEDEDEDDDDDAEVAAGVERRGRGRPRRGAERSARAPERAAPERAAPARGSSSRGGRRRALTVGEFAERFIEEHVDVYLKPSTARHYRAAIENHILPAFGEVPLDKLTTADVQRLHRKMRATPGAANTMRLVLGVLYSKAERWEVTDVRNPARRVERFKERAVERFLSPEERQRLEAVLVEGSQRKANQAGYIHRDAIWAIRLLTLTGMRRGELLELTWEQVDWSRGMLRLPDSKTGKRDIVVSDAVLELLREIAEAKGRPRRGRVVCSRTGERLISLGWTWRHVRELAGLPDLRLHDLRHSVASDAIMEGVPLEVVGKMLGHRNYRTTQRYAHIADSALRDAVNKTSRTILAASRPPRRSE